MSLSNELISQFAKATNDTKKQSSETTYFGTIVEYNGGYYAKLDGSEQLTPILTTAKVVPGERVTVLVKDHSATVTGNITSPSASDADVVALDGKVSQFGTVLADKVDTKVLVAESARIDALYAENATITGTLSAQDAIIKNLEVDNINIKGRLDVNEANISTLNADNVNIKGRLEANEAHFNTLNADVADINTLIFGSASGTSIQTSFANAVIAQLGNAQIKSAMIESLSANKITAGDVITNNVRVMSEDGSLVISDETIQISDDNRVRVQIGKDAANDYSINIWDADGKLMFSEGGITDSAIKEAIIRNDMVAANANISGSKLNIQSLYSAMNADGSSTLKGSKIYLDDKAQTLDVAFTSMTTTVTETKNAIDNLEVGGRNLLLNTKTFEDSVSGRGALTGTTYRDLAIRHLDTTSLASGSPDFALWTNVLLPEYGETYTLSFYAKGSGEIRTFFHGVSGYVRVTTIDISSGGQYVYNNNQYSDGHCIFNVTGEWKRYWVVYKCDISGDFVHKHVLFRQYPGSDIYLCGCKLEKGSKATDWSPAPEDMANSKDLLSLVTTVSSQGTQLSAVQGQISSKVWKEDITTAVNGIEFGGRNYVLDSKEDRTIDAGTSTAWAYLVYDLSESYKKGITYCVSGECVLNTGNISNGISVIPYNKSINRHLGDTITTPVINGRFECLITVYEDVEEDCVVLLYAGVAGNTQGNRVTYSNIKLEKGNKATDWTPAPEDVEADLTTLNTQYSTLDQTLNNISATVGQHTTQIANKADNSTVTTVNNKVTDLVANLDGFKTTVSDTYTTKTDFNNMSIGGRNYLLNSDFKQTGTGTPGLGTGIYADKYGGYNGGIDNPTANYHAYIDQTTFGINVYAFNESNGLRNWKGLSYNFHQYMPDFIRELRSSRYEYWLSMDLYQTTYGGKIFGGFYYIGEGNSSHSFHSGQYDISGDQIPIGYWKRVSVKVPYDHNISSNPNYQQFSLYFYGYGFSSNTIVYMKNVKLEKGTRATDWTPAPEDIETRVSSTEASLTVLANKIGSTVTESNPLGTRMSLIEQTAREFSIKLENTIDDLSNLSVGGRNLISGTSTDEISLGGYPSSSYSEGKTYKTISIPTKDEYVLSFDAKSTVNGDTIVCHFYSPNTTIKCETSTGYTRDGNTDGYAALTMTNSWKRYWVKYTQNGANTTAVKNLIIGRRHSGDGSGSISIRSVKFEEGHVLTDWTPAPEDVSSGITSAAKTATNYLNFSSSGLVVGDMTASTLGKNVLIHSDGIDIRSNSSTVLASFKANKIELGKNNRYSVIDLCDGVAQIRKDDDSFLGAEYNTLAITSQEGVSIYTNCSVNLSASFDNGTTFGYSTVSTNASNPVNGTMYVDPQLCLETVSQSGSTYKSSTISMMDGDISFDGNGPDHYAQMHIYGSNSTIDLLAYGGIYMNSSMYAMQHNVYLGNAVSLCGYTTSQEPRTMFSMSSNNNVIVGYDNYDKANGNTHIYGTKINHYVRAGGVKTNYRPYYEAGDSVTIAVRTAGFVTSSSKQVHFTVPMSKPIIGNPTVTVSSDNGITVRQGGSYTHGSSASAYGLPSSYTGGLQGTNNINVIATFSDTTNAVNNDSCGIYASIKITFS